MFLFLEAQIELKQSCKKSQTKELAKCLADELLTVTIEKCLTDGSRLCFSACEDVLVLKWADFGLLSFASGY